MALLTPEGLRAFEREMVHALRDSLVETLPWPWTVKMPSFPARDPDDYASWLEANDTYPRLINRVPRPPPDPRYQVVSYAYRFGTRKP